MIQKTDLGEVGNWYSGDGLTPLGNRWSLDRVDIGMAVVWLLDHNLDESGQA